QPPLLDPLAPQQRITRQLVEGVRESRWRVAVADRSAYGRPHRRELLADVVLAEPVAVRLRRTERVPPLLQERRRELVVAEPPPRERCQPVARRVVRLVGRGLPPLGEVVHPAPEELEEVLDVLLFLR